MKTARKKTSLALALVAGLVSSATWSDASHACPVDPLISSVCVMAMVNWGDFGGGMYVLADGRLLSVSQNAALFSLLGISYGGDGRQNFGIPDLRGRVAVGSGQAPGMPLFRAGEKYGQLSTNLTVAQLPAHVHTLSGASVNTSKMTATTTLSGLTTTTDLAGVTVSAPASGLTLKASSGGTTGNSPAGASLATTTIGGPLKIYSDAAPTVEMKTGSIGGTLSATLSGTAPGTVSGGTATTALGGTATLAGATDVTGADQAVSLMQPSLVLNYYIAVTGTYPMRN